MDNEDFLEFLVDISERASLVTSVCTGSVLLARAGVLDGYRATSNKRAFEWAVQQSSEVVWQRRARWVADGNSWTSSGVTAGMDMACALVSEICGKGIAEDIANAIEYEAHHNAAEDPFAVDQT